MSLGHRPKLDRCSFWAICGAAPFAKALAEQKSSLGCRVRYYSSKLAHLFLTTLRTPHVIPTDGADLITSPKTRVRVAKYR